jgi:dTDP-4-dehydrorhamnose 3,5-epimerase
MNVERTALPGVAIISPLVRVDARGSFHESWQLARYGDAGLPTRWVQDNISRSRRGVLRGLHFQHPDGQAKLVSALVGEILDVAVDVRHGSATFGRAVSVTLSSDNGRQLYVPSGFAHGFLVLSDEAVVHYKCTEYYRPAQEHVVAWNDPDLGLTWPTAEPILSPKDAAAPRLRQLSAHALPRHETFP